VLSLLYIWILYNIPVLAVGVRKLRRAGEVQTKMVSLSRKRLPTFSIVVPVKDEEKVVGRLLDAFVNVNYPKEKMEIVVVEDGSVDKTVEICAEYASRFPNLVRLVRGPVSDGKPSALNYGLKHVKGEIVGVFDADSVPEPDALMKVARYFADPNINSVQGRSCLINADENMLTKLVSYEENVRFRVYFQGKDTLNLFVPIAGSCYFVRKCVLENVGGWDSQFLSEDMEMAAKLLEKGHQTKFAPDILSWQETPSNFAQFARQRLRWLRGCMEVGLRYGRLMVKKPGMKSVDAEVTLLGPYMLPLILVSYAMTVYTLLGIARIDALSTLFVDGFSVLSFVSLLVIGLFLVYVERPRKISNLLWMPFVYAYWGLQILLTVLALLQILLRRQRKWMKTVKSGIVTNRL
jgi:cellulose synthase/poly-beta-1,6-N-acetylglucosamine synthase-like glycosyltransferase